MVALTHSVFAIINCLENTYALSRRPFVIDGLNSVNIKLYEVSITYTAKVSKHVNCFLRDFVVDISTELDLFRCNLF